MRAADISAFVDIPTRHSCEKYLLALIGRLQLTASQVLMNVDSVGMDLAMSMIILQRKEVRNMKIATSFLAAVLFTGTLGAFNNAIAQDGILSKDEFAGTGYCHMTFPAIAQHTLGNDQPELSIKGDVVDFYGPCDTNPLGQDQIQDQKLEQQHRWQTEYESE
jgi:hypothetical protein